MSKQAKTGAYRLMPYLKGVKIQDRLRIGVGKPVLQLPNYQGEEGAFSRVIIVETRSRRFPCVCAVFGPQDCAKAHSVTVLLVSSAALALYARSLMTRVP